MKLSPQFWIAIIYIFSLSISCFAQETAESLVLVENGEAKAVLVIPNDAPSSVQKLAEHFIHIVESSTGAKLPLFKDKEVEPVAERVHIFFGECKQTLDAGLSVTELEDETWRIAFRGNFIFILGEPAEEILRPGSKIDSWYDSDPMRWAINDILAKQLGVRWLWPGELGTYVPKHTDFSIPTEEKTYQPRLKMRTLVVATMRQPEEKAIRDEALEWVSNHQGGERDDIPLRHGFSNWWEKYHIDHPDYFAKVPEGMTQREPRRMKLNLANPQVLDQIVEEYKQAGKPKYWNVTPNDGSGFDVSEAVRAWDIPANQLVLNIWLGRAELTARYVKWWNMIYERLAVLNPEVTLVTMAYSGYRNPPPKERPLTARTLLGVVVSYRAYDVWNGWMKYADELLLRPNWGHYGANGPHLPLKEIADYMRFASENRMSGFYMDSILGFWGTQGLNYYLMARLMVDPTLSVEEIVKEYVVAFGAGEPKIKEYFDYWQQFTIEWAHGHKIHTVPEGKYDALIREKKIIDNPFIGPRQAIPYIYTDEVLDKGFALLDEADSLIGDAGSEAAQRVNFLRQGLKELKLSRDCLALGYQMDRKFDPTRIEEFQQKAEALEKLRTELTPSHVIWGGFTTRRENKMKIKIRPNNLDRPESSGDNDF